MYWYMLTFTIYRLKTDILKTALYPSAKNISLVKKYVNLSFANNFIQKAVGVQYHLMYMCIVRVMIKNNYIWVT